MKKCNLFAAVIMICESMVDAQQDLISGVEGAAGRDLAKMEAEQLICDDQVRGRALRRGRDSQREETKEPKRPPRKSRNQPKEPEPVDPEPE